MTTSSTFCRANASRPVSSGASDVSASRSSGTCSSEQDVLDGQLADQAEQRRAQRQHRGHVRAPHVAAVDHARRPGSCSPIPPIAASASRFPGPATKSRPIASTGLSASTGSASADLAEVGAHEQLRPAGERPEPLVGAAEGLQLGLGPVGRQGRLVQLHPLRRRPRAARRAAARTRPAAGRAGQAARSRARPPWTAAGTTPGRAAPGGSRCRAASPPGTPGAACRRPAAGRLPARARAPGSGSWCRTTWSARAP